MASQILTWWFTTTLLGVAGLPLTTYLFRALPDRGYAFARTLGLLLTGYIAWLLAMANISPFGGGTLTLCAVFVFGLGLLVQRRRRAADDKPFHVRWVAAVGGWRLIIGYELIFLFALVFMAFLRAHNGNSFAPNPNPWYTERPMDFAFFNAIQRSEYFPPHDPWLSGFNINYYYLGYMLMAAVAQLSGLEPGVAYNLSLALIFALTALGIAGIVVNLMKLSVEREQRKGDSVRPRARSLLAVFAVALSIVFVLITANQGGALQVITGMPKVLALSGQDTLRAVINGLGPRQTLVLQDPFVEWGAPVDESGKPIPTTELTPNSAEQEFSWWEPSRALYDRRPSVDLPSSYYAITEFPAFSFYLGDMHPHVIGLPFGLLALALAFNTLARRSTPLLLVTWRGWIELALTGLVLGCLYAINSWDFPTYLLLYLLALFMLYLRLANGGRMPVLWPQLVQHGVLALAASFALFLPFYSTVKPLVGSKEPLVDLPLLGRLTSIIGFVTWDKTALHTFLVIFGVFLLPLVAFVFSQATRMPQLVSATAGANENGHVALAPPAVPASPQNLGIIAQSGQPALLPVLPWVVLVALVVGVVAGFPLLFLLPLALYAFLLALRVESAGVAFALLAAGLGALVCFGTELVYIRDVFEGGAARMNTIFKFYYQVWLIWGTLAGYAVWWIIANRRSTAQMTNTSRSTMYSVLSAVALGLTAILFLGALVYPWFSTFQTLREAQVVGLNGKTPRESTPGGEAGIAWLRENTRGTDIVLEASGENGGEAYDPTGRGIGGVSASTGLATVLGWPGHEYQWRGGDAEANAQIEPRRVDVDTIYSTIDTNEAGSLLARYRVNYVYVGQAERERYSAESLDKFAQLGEQVFAQDEVVIYKIAQ